MNNENDNDENLLANYERRLAESERDVEIFTKKIDEHKRNAQEYAEEREMSSKNEITISQGKINYKVFFTVLLQVSVLILLSLPVCFMLINFFPTNYIYIIFLIVLLAIFCAVLIEKEINDSLMYMQILQFSILFATFLMFFWFDNTFNENVKQPNFLPIVLSVSLFFLIIEAFLALHLRKLQIGNYFDIRISRALFLAYAGSIFTAFIRLQIILFALGMPFKEIPGWISSLAIVGGCFSFYYSSINSNKSRTTDEKSKLTSSLASNNNRKNPIMLVAICQGIIVFFTVWLFFIIYNACKDESKCPINYIPDEPKKTSVPVDPRIFCSNNTEGFSSYVHTDSQHDTLCLTTP